MTTLRCIVTQDSANSIPADISTNTWHFLSSAGDPLDDAGEIIDRLAAFYGAIDGLLSSRLAGTGTMKIYDLEENPPRAPIVTTTNVFVPGTDPGLPNEVAIALSYHAAAISGTNRARRRGRIFLGPWTTAVLGSAAGDAIVDAGAAGAIAAAAETLQEANAGSSCKWAVFSPTTAGAEPWSSGALIASTFEVVGGYVDNAFDTIRSRGSAPSDRSTFSAG
jgi:hypothetical protein